VALVCQCFRPQTLKFRALLRKHLPVIAPSEQQINKLPVERTPAYGRRAVLLMHDQNHVQQQRIGAKFADGFTHFLVEHQRLCPVESVGQELINQIGRERLHLPALAFEMDQLVVRLLVIVDASGHDPTAVQSRFIGCCQLVQLCGQVRVQVRVLDFVDPV